MCKCVCLAPFAELTRNQAIELLQCDEVSTEALVAEARVLRERHFGKRMIVQVLTNAQSGRCSEDCSFCSQSAHFETEIPEYPLKPTHLLIEEAERAAKLGATRFCIVTATRSATSPLVEKICPVLSEIKKRLPKLRLCLSMGFLDASAASKLKSAGADRYNHNLETSERYFKSLVSTHTWRERYETLKTARHYGFELCSGGIIGAGESDEDIIDLLFALKELSPESVPINFFNPRPGTPLAHTARLDPEKALRTLAITRLLLPTSDIRAAGGREIVLGPLQEKAFYCVSSIFTNGYLTTSGQGFEADRALLERIGYEIQIEME